MLIKLNGLVRADQVVPNLRSLKSILLTTFLEFEVKAAVWKIAHHKTFQCSM